MADPNPGLDGASEGAEDLELIPKEDTLPPELGDDPLDAIQDETARAEAKKHRAIARRVEKGEKSPEAQKSEKKEEPKAPAPSTDYLTKADFYKSNERKAVKEITVDPEIKARWADIIPFYTPRRGRETPEDIKEDIQDAITLFKVRNPDVIKDDSARDLTVTPVIKSGGGPSSKEPQKLPAPPNFKLPSQPKDWYKKKEG